MFIRITTIRHLSTTLLLGALLAFGYGDPATAQPTLADMMQTGEEKKAEADAPPSPQEPEPEVPLDELQRGTPRSSVRGFLTAANQGDFETAAKYLEKVRFPGRSISDADLAHGLKIVLDRTFWIDLDSLSDKPEGRQKDGLSKDRELVGEIERGDGGSVDVLLRRVTENGVPIWKFSKATLSEVPELYREFGYGILEHYLPAFVFTFSMAGVPLVEWLGILAAAGAAFVFAYLVTGIITWLLRRRDTEFSKQLSRFVKGPLRLAAGVLVFAAGEGFFKLTVFTQALLGGLEAALLIVAVAWTALRLLDVFGTMLTRRLIVRGQGSAVSIVPPARKVLKVLVVSVAVVAMLGSFGFNVTALVAGLGVGGIAFALAAQKTIENVFGGVTLFADQPVRVGDFCRFGDKVGNVESIGLYSTRVRTLDRTVITIPNSEFSSLQLENFTRRDKIWYHPTIGLRYETTPDQIRYILVAVREMLYSHPKVDPDPARIRFIGFGAFSLDFEIFAYVQVTDFGEFLEVAEDLNLRIMDIVEQAGSGFAFPSQTTYIEQGDGVDREAAEQAEQTVAKWREQGQLFLPGFPSDRIRELRGRLDYPPEGSPFTTSTGNGRKKSAPATE